MLPPGRRARDADGLSSPARSRPRPERQWPLRTEPGCRWWLQRLFGALQAQVAPQVHFGPQVQGWQEHCLLAHSLVISRLLLRPFIRTLKN